MQITVIVHPNSKNPRIVDDLLSNLHVYVREPALEGKANNATIDSLAKHFNVRRSQVIIISGEKSKIKQIKVI